MLPNEEWIIEQINGHIKIFPDTNKNGNKMYQNFWNAAKAVKRVKFIAMEYK